MEHMVFTIKEEEAAYEEAEYEDDDWSIPTSQETGHDPQKEEFCSGRRPLQDTSFLSAVCE